MSEPKAVVQSTFKSFGLLLLAFAGLALNLLVITFAGIALAAIAIMAANNVQSFRDNEFLILPLCIVIFLVLALPGFFIVMLASKLAGEDRTRGAIMLAAIGTLVWSVMSMFLFVTMGHEALSNAVILSGLVGNVAAQILAANLIRRGKNKQQSTI